MNFNQWYPSNFFLSLTIFNWHTRSVLQLSLTTPHRLRFISANKFLKWKMIILSKKEEKKLLENLLRRTNEREFLVWAQIESTQVLTEHCFITLTLIRSTKTGLTCSVIVLVQIFTRCYCYYDVCAMAKLFKCQCEHMWQLVRVFR